MGDREGVRADIARIVASRELACGVPGIVVFAWKNCGFATKARAALAERGIESTDVTIDKYSPLHAELAFTTGRTSVPYIYVDGKLVGGCDTDGDYPGLMG